MQVAILAGGLATRMRPATESVPKSLLPVADKPFLQHQLELLRLGGVGDVVLCIGHLGDQIEDLFGDGGSYGVRIRYSYERGELLGTAGALKLAEPLLDPEFLVLYGDSYLPLPYDDVMRAFVARRMPAMMTVLRNENRFDRSNVVLAGDRVTVYNKREQRPDMYYIDAGVSVLSHAMLDRIPVGRPAALDTDLLTPLAAEGLLAAYPTEQRFYEIGSPAGLEELSQLLASREVNV